jgi:adenosylcobinamide kinase/adenosylcobinamide-phosphate guanylyltransferase
MGINGKETYVMKSKLILVTGGARSGKSAFAEKYSAACPGRHGYIATAQALDREMAERIAIHRRRRPAAWQTFEIPRRLPVQLDTVLQQTDVILLDCLTLYFSNYLLDHEQETDQDIQDGALMELGQILDAAAARDGKTVIVVTNEIGCGIVPANRLSRVYRDMMGKINQWTAQRADEVYLTVSGITIEIKSRAVRLPGQGDIL